MRRTRVSVLVLSVAIVGWLVGLAVPAQAAPCGDGATEQLLLDGEGWPWDLNDDGSVDNGLSDAFDGHPEIEVGGTSYPSAPIGSCLLEEGGREVVYPEASVGGLMVSRKVYVPDSGLGFARFLSILRNAGAAPVTTTYTLTGNLGSDGSTTIQLTSSGDQIVTTADRWAVSNDVDAPDTEPDDPTLVHAWDGLAPGAAQTASPVTFVNGDDGPTFDYSITVPAGGTYVFMHLLAQRGGPASAIADAPLLAGEATNMFRGMSPSELGQLRNWALPTCRGRTVTIFGTTGDDVLAGTTGADVIEAGDGSDQVAASGGADRVCAGDGDDTVNGGGGKDQIEGGDDGDTLKGAGGNDLLLGGLGNDSLNGGPGRRDVCKGGPGADTTKACERGRA